MRLRASPPCSPSKAKSHFVHPNSSVVGFWAVQQQQVWGFGVPLLCHGCRIPSVRLQPFPGRSRAHNVTQVPKELIRDGSRSRVTSVQLIRGAICNCRHCCSSPGERLLQVEAAEPHRVQWDVLGPSCNRGLSPPPHFPTF